jgi:hypothetical protein
MALFNKLKPLLMQHATETNLGVTAEQKAKRDAVHAASMAAMAEVDAELDARA